MSKRRTLPSPTWCGSDNNLLPKYLAFLHTQSKQILTEHRMAIQQATDEADYYKRLVKRAVRQMVGIRARQARINRELSQLQDMPQFSDEQYDMAAAALLEHPSVLASRIDEVGSLVLLIRPKRFDQIDLGDFQIGVRLFDSNPIVTMCRLKQHDSLELKNLRWGDRICSDPMLVERTVIVNRTRLMNDLTKLDMTSLVEYIIHRIKVVSTIWYRTAKYDESTAIPIWKGHVAHPGRALKRLVEAGYTGLRLQRIYELEDQAGRLQEELAAHNRQIKRWTHIIEDQQSYVAELTKQIETGTIDIEAATRDLEFITTGIPGVMGMRFDEDGTPVVHIRSSVRGGMRRYDLGDLEIWLRKSNGYNDDYGVVPINLTRRTALGGAHPHLRIRGSVDDNWFNFGGHARSLHRLLREGHYGRLVESIVNILNTVYDMWDVEHKSTEIPLDEVWENRPRRRARRKKR